MKELLLMRHAKSDWNTGANSDHERPLNKRGQGDAERMGYFLQQIDMMPDFVYVSSAKRTQQTYQLWAKKSKYEGTVVTRREFYLSSAAQYLSQISQHNGGANRIMVIGHNPVMEEFASLLFTKQEYGNIVFPTAAIAYFSLPINKWSDLSPGSAALKWFVNPKLIKRV